MSGTIIAEKHIVIKAVDKVTKPLAEMNMRLDKFEAALNGLNGKFTNASSGQQAFRQAMDATKATVGETEKSTHKLQEQIDRLKGKTVKVEGDTNQAQQSLEKVKKTADELDKLKLKIKPSVDDSGLRRGQNESSHFRDALDRLNNTAERTSSRFTRLRTIIGGTFIGGLAAQGVGMITSSLQGLIGEAMDASDAMDKFKSTMKLSGAGSAEINKAAKEVKKYADETVYDLGDISNTTAQLAANGIKNYMQLTEAAGNLNAQAGGSAETFKSVAMVMTQTAGAGKLTTENWNQLADAIPGASGVIQKALKDNGAYTGNFRDAMEKGQISADEFNKAITQLGMNKGAVDAAKSTETFEGAFGNLKANVITGLNDMIQRIGKKRITNAINEASDAIVATMGFVIKLFDFFATHQKTAIALGTILASVFATSKIIAFIAALQKAKTTMMELGAVSKAMDFLGGLKGSGNPFAKLFGRSKETAAKAGAEAGAEYATRMERNLATRGNWFTRLFKGSKGAAATAGAEAGTEFTTRMGARAVESKGLLSVGKGIAGKLGAGISLGLSVIDFARGLTPSFKGDRWSMIGKGAGGLIGGGIGAFFGRSPASAAIGATIGNVLGGWVGKGAHKGWDLLTKVFNGDVSWSGVKKGFRSAMDSVAKWAGDTWSKITKWWNGEDDNKSKSSKSSKKQPSTKVVESLGGNNYSKRDIANVKAMNAAITAYTDSLKRLKSATKKNDPSKEINAMNKALTGSQKKLTSYAKTMTSFAKGFKALDKATKSLTTLKKELDKLGGKNDGFKKLAKDIQSLATTIKKTKFGTEIAKQMKAASEAVNGKHSFVGQFGKMISSLKSDLNSFKRTFTRDWRNVWRNLDDDADKGLSNVAKRVDSRFDSILSRTKKFESSFLKSWKGWISDVKSAFKSGFGKLPDYAASSMRQIVSRLNRGISGINSVISQFGGDKRLSTISYANGTLSHPGGKAILNDGPTPYKQELVWQPSRGWSLPKTQNAVYDLEPNSMVLDAPHTHSILSKAGIPHYAGGTLSDAEMDKIAEQFMSNPKQASRNLVLKLTDWSSSVRLVSGLGKSLAVGFSQSIANVLKDLLGIIKEPINGDWTPVIKSAFHYLHLPVEEWKVQKLLRQIQTESGGNEKLPQQGPSDDPDGDGSGRALGLLQFKRQTFANDAVPGHTNIWSGFDQLLAAITTLNRGGEGGWGNVGNGHGWASGVHMTHLDRAWIGDNPEHDEFVINPYSASAIPLMSEAWSTIMSHRPELRQTSANGFGQQLVSLVKMAVDRLDNIDIHPVVEMSELRRINDKQNALVYRQAKG